MECRSCGCTDQSPCGMGCVWVFFDLCSNCTPETVTFACRDEAHSFDFTIRDDGLYEVDGETYQSLEEVSCPECGSDDVLEKRDKCKRKKCPNPVPDGRVRYCKGKCFKKDQIKSPYRRR